MRIIPVIDVLNGVAVHAVKGERSKYQPLKSRLCSSVDPVKTALAFKKYGVHELYVADLDAILCKGTNIQVLQQIVKQTGLELMVDLGTSSLQHIQDVFNYKISKVIIGTETLPDLRLVKDAIAQFGQEKIVVSLDLKNGKVLSKSEAVTSMDVLTLARELEAVGVFEMIVLDLARVGSGEGVDFTLLSKLRGHLQMKLLIGGGIRGIDELLKLKECGVNGVLLATALHSGTISVNALHKADLL